VFGDSLKALLDKASVGGWPSFSIVFLSVPEQWVPALAFFARAGSDAVCTISFMPSGLHRTYSAHHLHFITCSRYQRLLCEFARTGG
jgi:hypothetical protein